MPLYGFFNPWCSLYLHPSPLCIILCPMEIKCHLSFCPPHFSFTKLTYLNYICGYINE